MYDHSNVDILRFKNLILSMNMATMESIRFSKRSYAS